MLGFEGEGLFQFLHTKSSTLGEGYSKVANHGLLAWSLSLNFGIRSIGPYCI